jgi:hypothetical protein
LRGETRNATIKPATPHLKCQCPQREVVRLYCTGAVSSTAEGAQVVDSIPQTCNAGEVSTDRKVCERGGEKGENMWKGGEKGARKGRRGVRRDGWKGVKITGECWGSCEMNKSCTRNTVQYPALCTLHNTLSKTVLCQHQVLCKNPRVCRACAGLCCVYARATIEHDRCDGRLRAVFDVQEPTSLRSQHPLVGGGGVGIDLGWWGEGWAEWRVRVGGVTSKGGRKD